MPYGGAAVLELQDEGQAVVLESNLPRFPEARGAAIGVRFPTYGTVLWEYLSNKEPVVIDDVGDGSHLAHAWHEAVGAHSEDLLRGVVSFMSVPMIAKGEIIGLLTVSRNRVHAFTPEERNIAVGFAAQAALAFQNARLFEQTQRRASETETLARIAASFTLAGDIGSTLANISQEIVNTTSALACDLTLLDEQGNHTAAGGHGLPEEYIRVSRELLANGAPSPIALAARRQQTLTFPRARETLPPSRSGSRSSPSSKTSTGTPCSSRRSSTAATR